MRVANVEGLVTLFYDGSKPLFNEELHDEWLAAQAQIENGDEDPEFWENWGRDLSDECKVYWRERQSWQQIIVVDGVTSIPEYTFDRCFKIKRVIFSNSVVTIFAHAFYRCYSLAYIKWSINIVNIHYSAFYECDLSSVFMPPTCTFIGRYAFGYNRDLSIFKFPEEVQFGDHALDGTKLMKKSPYSKIYERGNSQRFENWVRNLDQEEEFTLHRACCSYQPLKEIIMGIVEERGPAAFQKKNKVGITPSKYLSENPYADISEMEIVRSYISKMMGELE